MYFKKIVHEYSFCGPFLRHTPVNIVLETKLGIHYTFLGGVSSGNQLLELIDAKPSVISLNSLNNFPKVSIT